MEQCQTNYLPKKNSNCNPTKIIYNGQELNDSKKIADAFGDYFANVGENLAREIPKVDKSPLHKSPSRLKVCLRRMAP